MKTSLITADLQLADNPRDEYRFTIFFTLRSLIRLLKADRLLLLGDLTEAKDRHSSALVNHIVNELAKISKLVPVIILRGNHEGTTPDNPFFRFVGHIDNIRWVNSPAIIGQDLFLPHTLDHKRDWAGWLDECKGYTFAHNTFEGARGSNGRELKGIPLSIFPKGSKVISGDVHSPQKTPPVEYVGAPYRVDFGDEYDPRVIMINDRGIESIPVYGPQKRLVDLTMNNFNTPGWPSCETEINECDILKVRVHIEMKDVARWSEIRDNIRQWGKKHNFVIHTIQPIVEYIGQKNKKQSRITNKTDEQQLHEFARQRDVDERTLKQGLKLIKDV